MKIIEKLKKLINHAESAKKIGNIAEAEAFAGKIQELLDAHNLSLLDIEIDNETSVGQTFDKDLLSLNQWQKLFILNLAALNSCRLVSSGRGMRLIGGEDDRLIVLEIYRYFQQLGQHIATIELDQWKKTPEYQRKRKKTYHSKLFRSSFLHGYIVALVTRFREKHELAKKQTSNSQALIFIGNKLDEADKWIEKNLKIYHPKPKKIKWSKFKNDAFLKGNEVGNSVALTTKTIS